MRGYSQFVWMFQAVECDSPAVTEACNQPGSRRPYWNRGYTDEFYRIYNGIFHVSINRSPQKCIYALEINKNQFVYIGDFKFEIHVRMKAASRGNLNKN